MYQHEGGEEASAATNAKAQSGPLVFFPPPVGRGLAAPSCWIAPLKLDSSPCDGDAWSTPTPRCQEREQLQEELW